MGVGVLARCMQDGNVGIGTTNPGVPLDVQAGQNITISNYGYISTGGSGVYSASYTAGSSIRAAGKIVGLEIAGTIK